MLMWYIIFVLLILFTGGGLLYLGTRAAKFVPAGSTPKRRLLIGLSAVILIFAVIAWLINLMNAVVCLLHFVFLWLICDFIFTLVRRFRKRPFKRYYAGYAATALSLAALAAGWYLNHRVWVTAYTIESEKAISDLRIVLFADSHIGTTFDGEGFAKHVRAMQEQNPDLVVIAGDFVDDGTGREEMVAAARALGTLKTPRGVYFAFGNHDKGYYGPAYRGFSSGEHPESGSQSRRENKADHSVCGKAPGRRLYRHCRAAPCYLHLCGAVVLFGYVFRDDKRRCRDFLHIRGQRPCGGGKQLCRYGK